MDLAELTGVRVARTLEDLRLDVGEAYLGGGSWLYSTPQPRVTRLVDLGGLGWRAVEPLPDGGLRIAGTCTIAALLAHTGAWSQCAHRASFARLVRECADAFLMSFKIWQVATVGGNLCLGLPAGAMISLTTALGGVVHLCGPAGERLVPVADFVTGAGRTVRATDEVVRGVEIPADALRARYAFRRIALSPLGRSSAVVIARRDHADDGGGFTLSLTAATTRPVVARPEGPPLPGAVADVWRDAPWFADAHGPADWRAHVAGVLTHEATAALAREAA